MRWPILLCYILLPNYLFFRDLSCFLSATIPVSLGTKDSQTTKF